MNTITFNNTTATAYDGWVEFSDANDGDRVDVGRRFAQEALNRMHLGTLADRIAWCEMGSEYSDSGCAFEIEQ